MSLAEGQNSELGPGELEGLPFCGVCAGGWAGVSTSISTAPTLLLPWRGGGGGGLYGE